MPLLISAASGETIGIHCTHKNGAPGYSDYSIDLAARIVSWSGANGTHFSAPAQISATTIDWIYDSPGVIKEVNHVDRSTGFMRSIVYYDARLYGSRPAQSFEYQCQKTQGF